MAENVSLFIIFLIIKIILGCLKSREQTTKTTIASKLNQKIKRYYVLLIVWLG